MKRTLSIINAIVPLAVIWYFALAPSASAQSGTYTQFTTVEGRSGELNFFGVELKDSSGTLRGNYSLECNTNAINNFTCRFALTLDSVSYVGKVTQVTTYFPANDADNDDHGPFAYNWSATGNGVTLTGSSQGNGHWAYDHGYQAFIEAGTTVTVNGAQQSKLVYPCGSDGHDCLWPKQGRCWWDGKGADWQNIRCVQVPTRFDYWIAESVLELKR